MINNTELVEWVEFPNYFGEKFIERQGFHLPGYCYPSLEKIKNFKYEKDDVIVATYPKSGTTWVQEIVYCIMNDCDFKKASARPIDQRVPFMEFPDYGIDYINTLAKRPKILKTHLPLCMLPDNIEKDCKIVYVLRNPRDTEVSYYHFTKGRIAFDYRGDFNDFLKLSINGQSGYGPWYKHVDCYASLPNILLIYYEDLHEKPFETIKSLCRYLGKDLTDGQINSIIRWTSFDNMKENKASNYIWDFEAGHFNKEFNFFRKGKIGDWINHFTKEQMVEFDQAVKANLKTKHDFNYGFTDEEVERFYSNN